MSEKPSYEDLLSALEAEKKARDKAEKSAEKAKKDAAVAKRRATSAEKAAASAQEAEKAALEAKTVALKAEKQAREVAEDAEIEAARTREALERLEADKGEDPGSSEEEPLVSVRMAKRDKTVGHFRATHSATYKGRQYLFENGRTVKVPEGLAEELLEARDYRVRGTPEGARIFSLVD